MGGAFDSEEIGPWTYWNGDLDARIFVVGQEWGDVDSFERQKGRDTPSGTNRMLEELLGSVGFHIDPAPNRIPASGVFLTNAALCLKLGGVQAQVRDEWFKNCGVLFLRDQVELVDPRVVIALGQKAYLALCFAFGIPRIDFRHAVNCREAIPLPTGAAMVVVYHCGQRMQNTHRSRLEQFEDWKLVKRIVGGED
jgi:DNA polymerase